MGRFIAAILCLLTPLVAGAGSAASGKIHSLIFTKNGAVTFWSTGSRVDQPGCAADDRWTIYPQGNEAVFQGLLMAYSSGKSVVIQGTGNCANLGEEVLYFFTVDSTAGTGKKVAAIVITSSNFVKVYLAGTRTDRPACAGDDGYILSGSYDANQAMLSTLQAAQASGKKVVVVGSGTCSAGAETVQQLYTQDLSP